MKYQQLTSNYGIIQSGMYHAVISRHRGHKPRTHTPKGDCMTQLYECIFTERLLGNPEITYPIREEVEAETSSQVVIKLYNKYGYVQNLVIINMDK